MSLRRVAVLLAALALADCATAPPVAIRHSSIPPEPTPAPPPAESAWSRLPGWTAEDHAQAFAAYRAGCPPSLRPCALAGALGSVNTVQAKAFFEQNFRPEPVGAPGVLTGYFMPVYPASHTAYGVFTAPVRPRPGDLLRTSAAYPDRTAIEARPAEDALAWMRPEDLFFMQVQGSGVLTFQDGRQVRAVFDGSNNAAFRGIAAPMRSQGLLVDADTSAEAIRSWLAAHTGPTATAIMQLNPRYVFFRLIADDGGQPKGAANTPLIPGRSLAVDPAYHAMGELFWVDAAAPLLTGAYPTYRRLAVALDTGGAIKGPARADLFIGRGAAAGREAGRVRHALNLYRLVPLDRPTP